MRFQVGITAITNALQCYRDTSYLQRIYSPPAPTQNTILKTTFITHTIEEDDVTPPEGRRASVTSTATATQSRSPVTPLSARTFGTWNIAVGIARVYAAYHLNEQSWYQMSMWTNIIGLVHFGTEAFVYKTAKPRGPWLAPIIPAGVGLIWHILQMKNYVKS